MITRGWLRRRRRRRFVDRDTESKAGLFPRETDMLLLLLLLLLLLTAPPPAGRSAVFRPRGPADSLNPRAARQAVTNEPGCGGKWRAVGDSPFRRRL
jgi:hypothetical protein